jgi:hypothetical protein
MILNHGLNKSKNINNLGYFQISESQNGLRIDPQSEF